MKNTIPLGQVLREALYVTWHNKMWWILGLLGFFLSGSLGYQLVAQGIGNLTNPIAWINRWQSLTAGASPFTLLAGQWNLLMRNPLEWFTFVGVWILIGLVLFWGLFVCVYAVATIISAMKIREEEGALLFGPAVREAWFHIRSLLVIVILTQLVSNALLALFSGPVLALTLYPAGIVPAMALVVLFLCYVAAVLILAMMVMYSLLAVVMYDLPLFKAIKFAVLFLWQNWFVSLKLLLAQVLVTVVAAFVVGLATSFVVIPVTIAGYILVANQQYDITQFLPNLILVLTMLGFLIFGAAYTLFQFVSWALLFLDAQERGTTIRVSIEQLEL